MRSTRIILYIRSIYGDESYPYALWYLDDWADSSRGGYANTRTGDEAEFDITPSEKVIEWLRGFENGVCGNRVKAASYLQMIRGLIGAAESDLKRIAELEKEEVR